MDVDGRTHEKRLVCLWVRGFLKVAVSRSIVTDDASSGTVYLVTVRWGSAPQTYAIDLECETIQRVVAGEIRSLVPLDAEYDDSGFSVSLRDALEALLGGDVNLYRDYSGQDATETCAKRVARGDLD